MKIEIDLEKGLTLETGHIEQEQSIEIDPSKVTHTEMKIWQKGIEITALEAETLEKTTTQETGPEIDQGIDLKERDIVRKMNLETEIALEKED